MAYLSPSFITMFIIMLVSGLSSTLDSNLCAISSIIAVELKGDIKRNSRIGMVLLTIAGLLIANVPNMPIVTLFLIYGVLRTSVFAGTVTTILSNKSIKERNIFYGILLAMLVGVPLYVIGASYKNMTLSIFATIFTLITPYIFIKLGGEKKDGKIHFKEKI